MGASYQVITSWYGIKIYEEFERFMAGRIDWALYITKLYEALDKKVNDMLYGAFMGLDSAMPAEYQLSGSVTEEGILDLVEKVQTANGGAEVMIAAPRAALRSITKLSGADMWSDAMKDSRNTTGSLGTWNGVELVQIPQVFEQGKREFKYSQTKFYVLPKTDNKPIKLVYEGDYQYFENTTAEGNRDMTIEAEYMTKLGVAVIFGADYAVGDMA